MSNEQTAAINEQELIEALSSMIGNQIIEADYNVSKLHGGTLGDVYRLIGIAKDSSEMPIDYQIVLKVQKKWQRNFDEHSWRREYDLYNEDLTSLFTESFGMPECHLSIREENQIRLWLTYVEGVSGNALTPDMCVSAAYELGRFQGMIFRDKKEEVNTIKNLSSADYQKKNYQQYQLWQEVYDYIREEKCDLPNHLCQMLIDMDDHAMEWWSRIEALPIVLCHRDYWITNIFYDSGRIKAIDWDTTGWGYLGEDLASLIADEPNMDYISTCYDRVIMAYYNGFSEFYDDLKYEHLCIYEMMLFMYGYRLVAWYKYAENDSEKEGHRKILQIIYDIGHIGEPYHK